MRMHIEDTQRMRLPRVRDIGLCTHPLSPRTSIHRLPMKGCLSTLLNSTKFSRNVKVRVGTEKRAGRVGSVTDWQGHEAAIVWRAGI